MNGNAGNPNRRWPRGLIWLGGGGLCVALIATVGVVVWGAFYSRYRPPEEPPRHIGRMLRLDGGEFRMGNDDALLPAERPAHDVRLGPFWIDAHEVTNRQFSEFVQQTGYRTTAQQRGTSLVLDRQTGQRHEVAGADWEHPGGPHTSLSRRETWPVVHVSWYDARAYADWSGKQLPTEAQWEYAARSGLRDGDFPWGREELIGGRYQANYRQGPFPQPPRPADRFEYLAPVMSFPPCGYGLYDVSGNVWEWCGNWYKEDDYQAGRRDDPSGPAEGTTRALRGGSWATGPDDHPGHTVWARWHRRPDYSSDEVGFRCVRAGQADRY